MIFPNNAGFGQGSTYLSASSTTVVTALTTSISDTLSASISPASTTATLPYQFGPAIPSIFPLPINTTGPDRPGSHDGQCQLLGPFAILVQAALGALALSSLVFKRWRERPQRPVKVWAFDVSKQVFGTLLLHVANLLMSMFSSGQLEVDLAKAAATTLSAGTDEDFHPNPCSFYILNLGIDTTIGVLLLLGLLKILTAGAALTPLARPPESIRSGNYDEPPRITWWLKQLLIYFLGLICMKACVFVIFELCPWIIIVGDWSLRWTEGNQALQIAFVMFIFPLIMNAFQYYVVDAVIKKKEQPKDDNVSQHTTGSDGEGRGLLAHTDEHDHGTSIEDDTAYKAVARSPVLEDERHGSSGGSSSSTVVGEQRSGQTKTVAE